MLSRSLFSQGLSHNSTEILCICMFVRIQGILTLIFWAPSANWKKKSAMIMCMFLIDNHLPPASQKINWSVPDVCINIVIHFLLCVGVCARGVCTWMSLPYRQQMTALQDKAKSRKAWRSSKDRAYFSVWPSIISASSFSFLRESPRDEQWAVSVARVA